MEKNWPYHIEVALNNGVYPMSFKTSTIHEAFGCIENLSLKFSLDVDLDEVMTTLADIRAGRILSYGDRYYSIYRRDGEV